MGGVKERKTAKKVGGNMLFSMDSPDFILLQVCLNLGWQFQASFLGLDFVNFGT